MKSKDFIQKKADRLIQRDKGVNEKLRAMDAMWHNEWEPPPELAELPTTCKAVDSSPSDALSTAKRTFSSKIPKPTLQPLGPHPANKDTVNNIERALMWTYQNMDKRSETRLTPDIMESSLRYDGDAIQLINLPHHYDAIKASYDDIKDRKKKQDKMDLLEKRRTAALRKGDFISIVRNPQNVHSDFNEMGLECVLLEQEMTAGDIYARWESLASFLDNGKDDWEDEVWAYYDYEDLAQRLVWVTAKNSGPVTKNKKHTILDAKNDVPFISWAIRVGGSALESSPEKQIVPYLNNVYTSGSWELVNKMDTLYVSEGIKWAAGPKILVESPSGEPVDIEYGADQQQIVVPPGTTVTPWNQQVLDPGIMEIYDRSRADIDRQTAIRVLQNPEFGNNVAFATINALLKTALNGLVPWRENAERAVADLYELILLWVDYTGRPLAAYGNDKSDYGTQYTIDPTDFDANHIYMTVSMEAEITTDRVEQINAAIMMHKQLGYPLSYCMTLLGEMDPQSLIRDRAQEDFISAEIEISIQERMQESAMQLQAMQQQMMQMQQMQQQMAMQQQQGPPGMPPNEGFENLGGPGMDPAMGGMPPAMGNPQGTREQLTGVDKSGQQLAGVA